MGSATVRRFALVAAMVLLVPVWSRMADAAATVVPSDGVFVSLAATDAVPAPAVRRHVAGVWRLSAQRPEHGRSLVALAFVALLSLLRPVRWDALGAARSAPSPLVRRRHVISLRAPPLPTSV